MGLLSTPIDKCLFIVFLATMIDVLGVALTLPVNVPYTRYLQLVTVEGPSTAQDRGTDDCPECSTACIPEAINATISDEDEVCLALPSSPECTELLEQVDATSGYPILLYNMGSFVGLFWMPLFSDTYGRRKAIIISVFGSLSGFLLMGFSINFPMLCAARFWGGLFGATSSVTNAFIVDLTPPAERAKRFGMMTAFVLLAFLFGPLVGAALLPLGLRVPYYAAAGLSFLALFLCFVYVRDPRDLLLEESKKRDLSSDDYDLVGKDEEKNDNDNEDEDAPLEKPHKIPCNFRIVLIACQTMLTTLAFLGLNLLLPIIFIQDAKKLGISESDCGKEVSAAAGLWFAICGFALILIQVPILIVVFPKLINKFGMLPVGAVGCFLLALAVAVLPLYPSIGYFFISMPIAAMGNGLQQPISSTYLSAFATKGNAAKLLAIGSFADATGNIIGPNLTQLLEVNQRLPFYIAAGCGVLSGFICILLWVLTPKPKTKDDEDKAQTLTTLSPLTLEEKEKFLKEGIDELNQWFAELVKNRNIFYGLIASDETIREESKDIVKSAIKKAMPRIPNPDKVPQQEFRNAWVDFALDAGRQDLVEAHDWSSTRLQEILGGLLPGSAPVVSSKKQPKSNLNRIVAKN